MNHEAEAEERERRKHLAEAVEAIAEWVNEKYPLEEFPKAAYLTLALKEGWSPDELAGQVLWYINRHKRRLAKERKEAREKALAERLLVVSEAQQAAKARAAEKYRESDRKRSRYDQKRFLRRTGRA